MAKLVWRVKLVTERQPGVTTETELACIERNEQAGLADLGLSLAEAKQLTAALQAEIVPAQMTALSAYPQACAGCGRRLAAKGHYGARFRSLFGDVPVRVRRWFVCACQGESEAKSVAALDFGGDGVAPELACVTARYAALMPFGKVAALLSELLPISGTQHASTVRNPDPARRHASRAGKRRRDREPACGAGAESGRGRAGWRLRAQPAQGRRVPLRGDRGQGDL